MTRLSDLWAGFEKRPSWQKWAVYGLFFGVIMSLLYSYVNELNFITLPLISIPLILLIGSLIFDVVVLVSAFFAPIVSTSVFYMFVGGLLGLLYERNYLTAKNVVGVSIIAVMGFVILQIYPMFYVSVGVVASPGSTCTQFCQACDAVAVETCGVLPSQWTPSACWCDMSASPDYQPDASSSLCCVCRPKCSIEIQLVDAGGGQPLPGVGVGIDQGLLSLTKSTNSEGLVSAYVACDKDVDVIVAKGATGLGGVSVSSETIFTIRSDLLAEDVVRRVQIEVPVEGLPEPTTTTSTIPACTDTDGGNVAYYEKGTVRDRYGRVYADFCYGDLLREYHCKTDNTAGYILHTCPYGCVGGQCIPHSATTTTTHPIYTTTTTTTIRTTTSTLKTCTEGWMCKNSYKTYVSQDCKDVTKQYCPLGCLSGECLTEETTTTSSITTTTEKHFQGEIKTCLTSGGGVGQTTYIDGRWSACTISCTTGEMRSCVTTSGETGTQKCVSGVWKECVTEEAIPLWMIILGSAFILIIILIIVIRQ